MVTRSASLREGHASVQDAGFRTIVVLVVACAASAAVALLNQPYFDAVNGLVGAKGPEARGLLFSSWLLLVGLPIVAWRPAAFGFTLGSIRRHLLLVGVVLVTGAAVTSAILAATGPIPYSEASWFIEIVDVPITEELVFRGVLLTALLAVLRRLHDGETAVLLAVLIDGLAFGLAHLANAADLDLGFVLAQATFATVLGSGCAFLMARTGSIYPAIALHAVVNGVVVAT